MNSIFFLGGQFAPDGGGQFESDCIGQPNHLRGGQFDRCLQIPVAPFETVNVIGVVAPHEIDVAEALIIGIFSITILLIESASIY